MDSKTPIQKSRRLQKLQNRFKERLKADLAQKFGHEVFFHILSY